MARILSVAEYGALASILAMFIIMSMPSDAVQNTIIKYVSINRSPSKLKNILKRSIAKALRVALAIFLLYALIAYPLSIYLDIGYVALVLSGLMIFFSFLNPVTRGLLLGEKKFNSLGWNMISEGFLKVLLGALLVLLFTSIGFSIFRLHGAILGALAGAGFAFLMAFASLRRVIFSKEEKADVDHIYEYAMPSFFVTFAVLAFIGIDVIIARAVFDPEISGSYAIASVLAKAIFLGTYPISRAVFPLASDQTGRKKNAKKILLQSLWMIVGLIVVSLVFLAIFPTELILIFSGKSLPMAERVIFYIGLAASLVSVANLLLVYRLSMGKIRNSYLLLSFLVLEVILLLSFSQTLMSFTLAFLSGAIIFLIGSLVVTLYEN